MPLMDHPASLFASLNPVSDRVELARFIASGATRGPRGLISTQGLFWYLGNYWRLPDPTVPALTAPRHLEGLAQYAYALDTRYRLEPITVETEYAGLVQHLGDLLQRYILDKVERSQDGDDHWVWREPFTDRHPTLNYYDAHSILAVRLAWICVYPDYPLPPDKRPAKVKDLCPEDRILRGCVNPRHYYFAYSRMDPAPYPVGRRGLPDGRTSKSVRWDEDDEHPGTIRCAPYGHVLARGLQDRFKAFKAGEGYPLPKYVHCPGCYGMRMDQSGAIGRQRRGTGALVKDEAKAQEFEREFMEIAARNGRFDPNYAEHHDPNYRGQVVPPEPEPYLPYELPDQNEI